MGFTFLTPLDALFVLAAAIPLAALWFAHTRMERVRRLFSLRSPRRRELAGVVAALVILPALLGVAAAQPVVVHHHLLGQRLDVQVFFVFDTSTSMSARTGPHGETRLAAREAGGRGDASEARRASRSGVASMTDRVLPNLMPTTNATLLRRTLQQSIGINQPPPGQRYRGRATTFSALYPVGQSNFYSPGVRHRIFVVFTDGEFVPIRSAVGYDLARAMTIHPLFVHVWAPTERIYIHGKVDPRYRPDPTSASELSKFAVASNGRVYGENDIPALTKAIRTEAGNSPVETAVLATRASRSRRGSSSRESSRSRSCSTAGTSSSRISTQLFEPQREHGARIDGPSRVLLEGARDRGAVDDRIAPVVERDSLGEELGAEAVTVAGDRIHAQPGAHAASFRYWRSLTGSRRRSRPEQRPPRVCTATSSANTSSALRMNFAAPSG